MTRVGIVVIGRNEAPRLGACLDALVTVRDRTVYVDSGSTDGSADIAEGRGFHVVRLTAGPFTAARGRQVGLDGLRARRSDLKYVQFVDGDCILQPGWLEQAIRFLDERPATAVVVGHISERHADHSLLSRLVNTDWDLPTGESDAIGGISMARVDALRQVGGWHIEMIAGEELDLGIRLRTCGWKLVRIPQEMALHDMGISGFSELWHRSIRTGFCYAELAGRHGRSRCRRWLRRAAGNLAYGAVFPVWLLLALFIWWPLAAAIAALYLLLIGRIALARMQRGDPVSLALLYGILLCALKVPAAMGTLKFLLARMFGRRTQLIEYKAVASWGDQ